MKLVLLCALLLFLCLPVSAQVTAARLKSGNGAPTYTCVVGPSATDFYWRLDTHALYYCSAAPNTWTLVPGGGGGGGDALTSNPLSQFASTTSAQLAGVLSNETGTGLAVFGTAPSLTGPIIGNFTVATLPGGTSGKLAYVTDGASATDCTSGGGSTKVLCVFNGSAWAGIGGGGSGTVTSFSIDTQKYTVANATTTPAVSVKAVNAIGNITGATTVNWNNGAFQSGTLTGNVTFTFSNPVNGAFYKLIITQDATGGRVITWPAGVRAPSGATLTVNSAASSVSVVEFIYDGTNYTGAINNNPAPGSGYCSYKVYIEGSTYKAVNTSTGALIASSATDAFPVVNAAVTAGNNARVCVGHGLYNFNTVGHDTGGGLDTYYAVGLPANSGTAGVPGIFTIEGEGPTIVYATTGPPAPVTTTTFYITPTAVTTVPAGKLIVNIWALYDSGSVGSVHHVNNLSLIFPDNSRGNEHAMNFTQALGRSTEYNYMGFNQAEADLVVTGASTFGSYGIVTQQSNKINVNYGAYNHAVGFDAGYRIGSEHWVSIKETAAYGRYPGVIGDMGGVAIQHPMTVIGFTEGAEKNGWIFANGIASGTRINFIGYDQEVNTSGIWTRVANGTEETPGSTSGSVDYTNITSGTGIQSRGFFESGHGTKWQIWQGLDPGPTIPTPQIRNGDYIRDGNSNELIKFTTTASAVNEVTLANAATGNAPTLTGSGGDTNISVGIVPKGTGFLNVGASPTVSITSGSGAPEGAVTAVIGSIYLRTDGSAGTSFCVKESGSGNTGWSCK